MMAMESGVIVEWRPKVALEIQTETGLELLIRTGTPHSNYEDALADAQKMSLIFGDSVVWVSASRNERKL